MPRIVGSAPDSASMADAVDKRDAVESESAKMDVDSLVGDLKELLARLDALDLGLAAIHLASALDTIEELDSPGQRTPQA